MKKAISVGLLPILFTVISLNIQAQNLKKAFKYFEEGNYYEADQIFKSEEFKNTCIGLYGQAVIMNYKSNRITSYNVCYTKLLRYLSRCRSVYMRRRNSSDCINGRRTGNAANQASLPRRERLQAKAYACQQCRITSYNVCYTKLLRLCMPYRFNSKCNTGSFYR